MCACAHTHVCVGFMGNWYNRHNCTAYPSSSLRNKEQRVNNPYQFCKPSVRKWNTALTDSSPINLS